MAEKLAIPLPNITINLPNIYRTLLQKKAWFKCRLQSSRWGPKAPTSHRTVRTGPYTALHANFTHFSVENQCSSPSLEKIFVPCLLNHWFENAFSTALVCDKFQGPLFEYPVFAASFLLTPCLINLLTRFLRRFCCFTRRALSLLLICASIAAN